MKRKLPTWCKEARKALIDRDMTVTDLSKEIGVERSYTSQIVSGRILAPKLAARISAELDLKVPYFDNII
ncbi:MAG: helix-turn-helix domain-containing protein [Lachnospiraceae bacterium]|nr:helix-turn-helix domain-containing protein [Lachnospiraceae bacterium]